MLPRLVGCDVSAKLYRPKMCLRDGLYLSIYPPSPPMATLIRALEHVLVYIYADLMPISGMLHVGVWIETCKMGVGKGCCIPQGSDSCCGDNDTWFDFVPGPIQAVFADEGINRLSSTVPISTSPSSDSLRTTLSPQTSTTTPLGGTGPPTSSQNNTGGGDDAVSHPGTHQVFSDPAIAVTAVLSVLLAASWAVPIFLWMKYGKWKKVSTGKVAELHVEESVIPQELPGN